MIELRWLTRSWDELHESGYKTKTDKVLQYRCITNIHELDHQWSEWQEVEEEFIRLTAN